MAIVVKPPATASENAAENDRQEATIERVLELRREMEELLESLPDEARKEVERRWRNRDRPPIEPPLPAEPAELAPEVPRATKPTSGESTSVEPADRGDSIDLERTAAESERTVCGGFALLDSDQDGFVSAGDRQWRFLRLWFDDGDGTIAASEIESLFELGVRGLDVQMRFFTDEHGDTEDIDVDTLIHLRNVGKRGQRKRQGVLVLDSDRLARDGILQLTDSEGRPLTGFQALAIDSIFLHDDGDRTPVLCQKDP